tara:strand:+ start:220 stop:1701 length:1482 start_codon:yes stop_codon:yes gene_type:complete
MTRILASLAVIICMTVSQVALAAKDSVVVGMRLEPPGLDPTMGAAAAISQITLYNIFEGLTRIDERGEVGPGLATSWTVSDDLKSFTFNLRKNVKFTDGTDFDSGDVKFTFERNAGEKSTNKRKGRFENMASIDTPEPHTVVITLKEANPLLLFNLGESTGVIVAPESAESNATNPVGTGPFKFVKWTKGDSVVLEKNASYRAPDAIRLNRVTFKFVGDANAQVAAMMARDVDVFPRIGALETLQQFENDSRFQVLQGTTEGETVLSTNNKRKPLNDARVRCAIAHALNRQEIIDGSEFGYATPIGSHFPPHHPAYVDLTDLRGHDLDKARALLEEAGYGGGLELTLQLPPPEYARRSGEIIAAQLAKVGIKVAIENVQWARWLDVVYKQKNYDLSIVSHVEPNDINIYANPEYYFQYDDQGFRDIIAKADTALDSGERYAHLRDAQRKLAEDCVNGFLFQLAKAGVARRELKGLWQNWPMFVNDMAAVYWED